MSTGFYLTILAGPVVPIPVPPPVLDALTGVTVTSGAGVASGFQLTFGLSQRSPLHAAFLLEAGQTPLMRVIIIVTLRGIPTVLMDGVTTRTEVTGGAQAGHVTLTVTGEDLTKVMNVQKVTGMVYPAMPPEARVALIIAKYAMFGMIPLVIPSFATDVPIPTERIPTHQGTDLEYIQQLARDAGHVFYIEPGPVPGVNTAYWGPEIKLGVPQPALNLDMDAHTNIENINFSFNTADTTLPIVLIQNPQTHFAIPIPIPKLNPLQPPLGLVQAPITNVTVLNDTAKLSPAQALSRGLAEAAKSADAVAGSGTLNVLRYGHVLRPRGLVGVRGAGIAYDGLYYVKSVTSTIAAGDFKQNFSLTRNGIVSITPVVVP